MNISVRIDKEIIKKIDRIAKKQKRSRNSMILIILEEAVKKVK
jgi:predicted transcriptional regulator